MLNHSFTFNGHSSDEFGIKIEHFPGLNRPARKYTVSNVPGRNGNLYEMQDAWEEVIQSYEIYAGGQSKNSPQDFMRIMEWLCEPAGYAELTDSYDVDHYREAVFVDATDIANSWNRYGRAVVSFRCRPERFLKNQKNITISFEDNSATLYNPTKHVAKPFITVTRGSGARTLRINHVCVDLPESQMIDTTAYINCENEDIYDGEGSLNATSRVYPFGAWEDYGFLRLEPGENTIVRSAGILSVTLNTRFWEI